MFVYCFLLINFLSFRSQYIRRIWFLLSFQLNIPLILIYVFFGLWVFYFNYFLYTFIVYVCIYIHIIYTGVLLLSQCWVVVVFNDVFAATVVVFCLFNFVVVYFLIFFRWAQDGILTKLDKNYYLGIYCLYRVFLFRGGDL